MNIPLGGGLFAPNTVLYTCVTPVVCGNRPATQECVCLPAERQTAAPQVCVEMPGGNLSESIKTDTHTHD